MQRLEESINFQIIDLIHFTNGPEQTVLQMTSVILQLGMKAKRLIL